MTDDTTTTDAGDSGAGGDQTKEQTFTQADLDRIVRERLAQQAKNKFGDYDDLKTKAEGAKSLEDRIAEIEARAVKAETDALRSRIAAEFGISAKKGPKGEPSDADLFLTGADEATLTAQAQRLGQREAERKKTGNVARTEGDTKSEGKGDDALRDWARNIFDRAD